MVDRIQLANPLQSFLQGQQAREFADAAPQRQRQRQLALSQGEVNLDQNQLQLATQRGQLLLNALNSVERSSADPNQRFQIAQRLVPELQKLGIDIDAAQMQPEQFTNEGIAGLKSELAGFVAEPQGKDLRTSAMKEFDFAKSQGFPGDFVDFQKRLRKAGATNVQTNIDTSRDEFFEKLGGESAKKFIDRREKALEGLSSLRGIRQARNLLDQGMITGTGADFRVGLGKALNTIGFNFEEDAIANTEAFTAAQAKQVANILSAFGAGSGLSDADRIFAVRAAGGDINMTEEAIRRILDLNETAVINSVKTFNEEAGRIPQGSTPFPLTIELPPDFERPAPNSEGQFRSSPGINLEGSGNLTLPPGATEEDIQFTMQKYGLSREEVIREYLRRTGNQ